MGLTERQGEKPKEVIGSDVQTELPESSHKIIQKMLDMARTRSHSGTDPSYRFTSGPEEAKPQ